MKTYVVKITEILETVVYVEAKNMNEAKDKVFNEFEDGWIILTHEENYEDFKIEVLEEKEENYIPFKWE